MRNNFFINLPHFIVFIRVALVFVIIALLGVDSSKLNRAGIFLILFIAFLDWLDGYTARRLGVSSKIGGLIDTLGDRITENTLLIFFACKEVLPLFVPLVFVTRSFLSDFIRFYAYKNNIATFSINKSKLGFVFVASKFSRAFYLVLKTAVFLLGGIILAMRNVMIAGKADSAGLLMNLRAVVGFAAFFLVVFNLLRFVFLLYDSRGFLKDEFIFGGSSFKK